MRSQKREAEELIEMSDKVIVNIDKRPDLYGDDAKEWWINHKKRWENKLKDLLSSCPECGGDCSAANPPVVFCPMGSW